MLITLLVLSALVVLIIIFLNSAKFGKLPSGARLEKIRKSPNFRNGSFQNLHHTPDLTEGSSFFSVLVEFFFTKKQRIKPVDPIPSVKTDLKTLAPEENVLVWFGHSSYFIQVNGKSILVDPVLSGSASPVSSTTKAFPGTDRYTPEDFPAIDILFLSHDHWDHCDYDTLIRLKTNIKLVVCGLGVGAHLERWNFDAKKIIEKDWNEEIELADNFKAYTVPARHFSGRGLSRNKSLWTSYVLQTPDFKIFIGGDSGYDDHFKSIGDKFGEFDLAILENGQYDKSWKYIHMMPDEVKQAAIDIKAKRLLAVHSAKFALANHAWDTPLKTIAALEDDRPGFLITPMIGQKVILDQQQQFPKWWEGVN